jgi:hypothetical protein
MAVTIKGGVKIVEGKAYVHPLSFQELEFLLTILADAKYKLEDVQKVLHVTKKLREEYKLMKNHIDGEE